MASRRGPDNSIRVAISGINQSTNFVNVFWVQATTSSSISQSDLDAWLNSFQAAYKTRFAPVQGTGLSYKQAIATCFTPGGSVLQSTVSMTGTGSEAGSALLELSASKIVSWLTTVYWRGGKPRTYLAGVQATDTVTGTSLTAAQVTAVQTAATNFRTDINALVSGTITGSTLGFVSFFTGSVPRVPPVFYAFTGAKVHPRLGTQRRRLGKWLV